MSKFSAAQLKQAQQQVINSKSYPIEKQHEDEFMNKMRHTLVNGVISAFKELTEKNQITNYDYSTYFINKYHRGPLHMVCENGRISLIKYFVEQKLFNINERIGGTTPFMLLTLYYIQIPERCTTIEILELMIAAGADPLARFDNHMSIGDLIEQQNQPLNLVLQYLKTIYFERERHEAFKNAMLLAMCDNENNNNNWTHLLVINDLQQIAEYLIGPIQQQIDQ